MSADDLQDLRGRGMTWEDIVALEPELLKLEAEIKQVIVADGNRTFCANRLWYGDFEKEGFKRRMVRLVGWEARNPKLHSPGLYDQAYKHLFELLPDCRHTGLICF